MIGYTWLVRFSGMVGGLDVCILIEAVAGLGMPVNIDHALGMVDSFTVDHDRHGREEWSTRFLVDALSSWSIVVVVDSGSGMVDSG